MSQVKCSDGKVTLYVFDEQYECSSPGQEVCSAAAAAASYSVLPQIPVDTEHDGIRYRGSLVCPACEQICYVSVPAMLPLDSSLSPL